MRRRPRQVAVTPRLKRLEIGLRPDTARSLDDLIRLEHLLLRKRQGSDTGSRGGTRATSFEAVLGPLIRRRRAIVVRELDMMRVDWRKYLDDCRRMNLRSDQLPSAVRARSSDGRERSDIQSGGRPSYPKPHIDE